MRPLGDRLALRGKVLAWPRTDIALWQKQAASSNAVERKMTADLLAHRLVDTDLSGLRPGLGRIGVPTAERDEWDQFWAEVRATHDAALKPPPPPELIPPPREVTEK